MKNIIYLIVFFLLVSVHTYAQMDNLVNVSSNWIASPARNAATDASDIVVYNPAGTVLLTPGLHINVGNQSLFRHPEHSYDLGYGMKTYTQDGSDPVLPNLYAAWVKNNWSIFGGVFVSGGGATLNYPHGSLTTDVIGMQSLSATGGAYSEAADQYLKASSYYLTTTVGAAYKVDEVFSFSFSLRYLNGMNQTEAGMTLTSSPVEYPDMPLVLDYSEAANGVSAVAGISIRPSEKFALTARYEAQAKMNFKTKLEKDDFGFTSDGAQNRRDLPAVLALGMAYKFSEKLNCLVDMNYYFQKNANWGIGFSSLGTEISLAKMAGDAVTYTVAANYEVTPKFTCSAGAGYTRYLYNDKAGYYLHAGVFETIQDNNMNLNIGASYAISKKVRVNTGFMHTSWAKDNKVNALITQPMNTEVNLNSSLNAVSIGAELTF
jgi:long-chain fatty acid transport protein